jgi:hypothetical protein
MVAQHLSDEAVAAFADGVLGGHARDRAARHVDGCVECRTAVQVQREAAYALRAAADPRPPNGLLDRLRTVPMTTPLRTLPTTVAPDGTTMLSTFAPMAALVPDRQQPGHRLRPYITTAAVLALAGALTAGSVAEHRAQPRTGSGEVARQSTPARAGHPVLIDPVQLFRGQRP